MLESLHPLATPLRRRVLPEGFRSAAMVSRRVIRPAGGPLVLALTAVWLCRRLVFTGGIPAGTDVFDLVTRAQQNAHWSVLLSPWSPSGLGLARQVSLDNLLGLLVLVTGDAPRTIAVLLCAALLASGLSSYWVAKNWYGDRVAATVTGLVYMTAQASLGRVASGWLHYEILVALAPILVHLWVQVVDRYDPARALIFALGASAVVFARQDIIFWLLPAFVVYVALHIAWTSDRRAAVNNITKATFTVIPAMCALSLYFIVPLRAGISAPWVTTGQVFEAIRFNLVDRSLDAYQSLLGFGRDLGYIPFNGEAWWNFHPWFPQAIYYAFQAVVVAACFAVLWHRRDERTIYLVLLAVVAAFLGKGIRGPVGEPYWFGVQHLPVFGSLRGPNRWLIEQSFCYAMLFGLAVRAAQRALVRRGASRLAGRLVLTSGAIIALLPVAPTLLAGLRTWTPTVGQLQLMHAVATEPGSFTVASVPYDQSMRYLHSPSYSGWEHDLGVESALYTGHSALSTNSWDQRGSDFVDYTASLLEQGDPAFARLLGGVGVRYLLGFDYPSGATATSVGPAAVRQQQRSLAQQPDARRLVASPGGALYANRAASPLLSFRTNVCVVLGGRSGVAAFADLPGIKLQDWAVQTADDLLGGPDGSTKRLVTAIERADSIVVADSTTRDLAVLSAPPVSRVPGITSDPGLDRRVGLLLNDESARRGSLADPSVPPPALVTNAQTAFQLGQPRRLELWSRVLKNRTAGRITFTIDGRVRRQLLPLEAGLGRFAWLRIGTFDFTAGHHTITVSGAPSPFGGSFEIDESRLVDPALRAGNERTIEDALRRNARKVSYVLSISGGPYERVPADQAPGKWINQGSAGIATTTARVPRGTRSFRLTGPRRFYTFATRVFPRPQSWTRRTFAVLSYWSSGKGADYRLLFDFDDRHTQFASYSLDDSAPGWHTAAIRLDPSWSHVVGIRVSTRTKTETSHIVLGDVRLLFSPRLTKAAAFPTYPIGETIVQSGGRSTQVMTTVSRQGQGAHVSISFPRSLASGHARVWFGIRTTRPAPAAVPVTFHARGNAHFTYSFQSDRSGMLVFAQTYDTRWRLSEAGVAAPPVAPTMSLVSGFVLGRGAHTGSIEFRGAGLVPIGVALSLLALVVTIAGICTLHFARKRQPNASPHLAANSIPLVRMGGAERTAQIATLAVLAACVSSYLCIAVALVAVTRRRANWSDCIFFSVLLLAISPLLIAVGNEGAADALAVGVVIAMVVAVFRVARVTRKARTA